MTTITNSSTAIVLGATDNPFVVVGLVSLTGTAGFPALYGDASQPWAVTNNGTIATQHGTAIKLLTADLVKNAGTVIGGVVGAELDGGGRFVNATPTALVSAGSTGVVLGGGASAVNKGTITAGAGPSAGAGVSSSGVAVVSNLGTAALIHGGHFGVNGYGGVSLVNQGTVSGFHAVYGIGSMSVTNAASGTISGTADALELNNLGATLNLVNRGAMSANGIGVLATGSGTIANLGTAASIKGFSWGAWVQGSGSVGNSGLIQASKYALQIGGGTVTNLAGGVINGGTRGLVAGNLSLRNGGTIHGNTSGVQAGTSTITNLAGGLISANTFGVYVGANSTIDNRGSISGSSALYIGAGGMVTNTGMITGVLGVGVQSGDLSLTNDGTIDATLFGAESVSGGTLVAANGLANPGALISGGRSGLFVSFVDLVNGGTIEVADVSYGSALAGARVVGGTITNLTGGVFRGRTAGIEAASNTELTNHGTIYGVSRGVWGSSGSVTITNDGMIAGGGAGVETYVDVSLVNTGTIDGSIIAHHRAQVTNAAGGLISVTGGDGVSTGDDLSVGYQPVAATIANAGTIVGASNGVRFAMGGTVANAAGGLIEGDSGWGVYVNPGAPLATVVDNQGTLSGTAGAVHFGDANGNVFAMTAGAVTTGDVVGGAGTDTLRLEGGIAPGRVLSSLDNPSSPFKNFEALALADGARWKLLGANTLQSIDVGGTTSTLTAQGKLAEASGFVLTGHGGTLGFGGAGRLTVGAGAPAQAGEVVITGAGTLVANGTAWIAADLVSNRGTVSGDGIAVAGGTLLNTGLLSGSTAAARLSGGTVVNLGLIDNASVGVEVVAAGTVVNSSSINGSYYGVWGVAALSLDNAGTITAVHNGGSGVYAAGAATITNRTGASILGPTGVTADGPLDLANRGTISATSYGFDGVRSSGGGILRNLASGVIGGPASGNAIHMIGSADLTVINAGYIHAYRGIYSDATGVLRVTNGGLINGSKGAVVATDATITNLAGGLLRSNNDGVKGITALTLTNAGTVQGFAAVRGGAASMMVNNTAGGTITGTFSGITQSGTAASGTVVNAGLVVGKYSGIYARYSDLAVTNAAGGVITNTNFGAAIKLQGAQHATLANAGVVISQYYGVREVYSPIPAATALSISNIGAGATIAAGNVAIYARYGTATVVNEAAISAHLFGVMAGTLTLDNGLANPAATIYGFVAAVTANAGTITNGGTLASHFSLVIGGGALSVTNTAGGVVRSDSGAGFLVNTLTLTNAGTVASPGAKAIYLLGTASNVIVNSGTISSANSAIFAPLAGVSLTNTASGLVSSGFAAAVRAADLTVVNAGRILASASNAIYAPGGGTVSNTGTIDGRYYGIRGADLSVTNRGRIVGDTDLGISAGGSGTDVVRNLGTAALISGAFAGVRLQGADNTLVNRGTITGSSGYGAQLSGGQVNNQGTAARIAGTVDGVYGGTIAVANQGTIRGDGRIGVNIASGNVANLGAGALIYGHTTAIDAQSGTIVNEGTLTGHNDAGVNVGDLTMTNSASGVITSDSQEAIVAKYLTLNNAGSIGSPQSAAIYIRSGGAGSVVNTGTITAHYQGIASLYASLSLTNSASGVISGDYSYGVAVTNLTATNAGTILSSLSSAVIVASSASVINSGSIGAGNYGVRGNTVSLTNSGRITSTGGAAVGAGGSAGSTVSNVGPGALIHGKFRGVDLRGSGNTLANGGTISSDQSDAVYVAAGQVSNGGPAALIEGHSNGVFGGTLALTNRGTIHGDSNYGVQLTDGSVRNFGTAALIEGGHAGVKATGDGVLVRNQGRILSDYQAGVSVGTNTTVVNSGSILGAYVAGHADGIDMVSGTIANSGSIGGTTGIYLGTGTLTNAASGTISGTLYYGVRATGAAVVDNAGSIAGSGRGVWLQGGGTVLNIGTITASYLYLGCGVFIHGGTLVNSGSIHSAGVGAVVYGVGSALQNAVGGEISGTNGANLGANGSLANAGRFLGTQDGVDLGGSTTVTNTGSIIGAANYGVRGLYSGIQVTNGGVIMGGDRGMFLGTGTVDNSVTSASISGQNLGIFFGDGGATVVNHGTIQGTGTSSGGIILNGGGSIANLGAAALISGADYGLESGFGATTVVNQGTIAGAKGTALIFGNADGNLLDLYPGSVLVGQAKGGSLSDTLELAAQPGPAGTITGIGTAFTGFEHISLDAAARWKLAGTNTFAAGTSLTLGTGAVMTVAGTLTTASDLTVTGTGQLATAGGIEIGGTSAVTAGQILLDAGHALTANGTLQLAATVAGAGSVQLAPGAALTITGPLSAALTFLAGGGETLALASKDTAPINGFVATDTIDLLNVGALVSTAFHPAFGVLDVVGTSATRHLQFAGGLAAADLVATDIGGGTIQITHS